MHRPGWDALTVTCAVMVAVQVLMAALGGFPAALPVYEQFGLSREGLMSGKVWQLATHALIHGTWFHLGVNLLVVYAIGGRILHILGGKAFVVIFWSGVLVGSVMHLGLHPAQPLGGEEAYRSPLVGASAGGMALLLALTTLSPDSRMWPIPVSGKNLGRGLLLGSLLLFLLTPGLGLPGFSAVGEWLVGVGRSSLFTIGHAYHLGGGLIGWLYVRRLLRCSVSLEQLRAERARREGMAA
jgi:membrane associated rhomboid family serine protease